MKNKLIKLSKECGFKSEVIGKSVESTVLKPIYYHLWLFELQTWLRNKYSIHIYVIFYINNKSYQGKYYKAENSIEYGAVYKTYEKALEDTLINGLKSIEND